MMQSIEDILEMAKEAMEMDGVDFDTHAFLEVGASVLQNMIERVEEFPDASRKQKKKMQIELHLWHSFVESVAQLDEEIISPVTKHLIAVIFAFISDPMQFDSKLYILNKVVDPSYAVKMTRNPREA